MQVSATSPSSIRQARRDPAGRFMGGTQMRLLTSYGGKLFAGTRRLPAPGGVADKGPS